MKNNMEYKTTIVIPNYNGKHFLQACLQTLPNIPTILVDNGSTDGSVAYVETAYPQITILRNETNTGFCVAVNQGIAAAKTPYVFLLNNDTTVQEGCVEALEACMESDERIFSVQAKLLQMKEPTKLDDGGDYYCALGYAYAYKKGKDQSKLNKRRSIFAACAGAALYRRSHLAQIGGFDELHFAYLEDMDLGYRAKIQGYRNVFEPEAIVYHVGSGASGSRYNQFKIDFSARNNVYLYCKNMPFLQLLLNLPLLLLGTLVKWCFFVKKKQGKTYLLGVCKGIKLSLSKEGRARHVRFTWRNLGHYCRIQGELWWNMLRMFA